VLDEIDRKHFRWWATKSGEAQIKNGGEYFALPELNKVQAAKVLLYFKRSGALSLLF
jgi:hypothetical protein